MSYYRLYILNSAAGGFRKVIEIAADDDCSALEQAKVNDGNFAELWQEKRLVAQLHLTDENA